MSETPGQFRERIIPFTIHPQDTSAFHVHIVGVTRMSGRNQGPNSIAAEV